MQVKTDELNDMTQKCLLRLKHQVQIWLPKQITEDCIVMFLNIRSANIAYHIIDVNIYYEAFAYFVDEVEIIMEVLDDEADPIEEVCVESEDMICNVITANIEEHDYALLSCLFRNTDMHLVLQT